MVYRTRSAPRGCSRSADEIPSPEADAARRKARRVERGGAGPPMAGRDQRGRRCWPPCGHRRWASTCIELFPNVFCVLHGCTAGRSARGGVIPDAYGTCDSGQRNRCALAAGPAWTDRGPRRLTTQSRPSRDAMPGACATEGRSGHGHSTRGAHTDCPDCGRFHHRITARRHRWNGRCAVIGRGATWLLGAQWSGPRLLGARSVRARPVGPAAGNGRARADAQSRLPGPRSVGTGRDSFRISGRIAGVCLTASVHRDGSYSHIPRTANFAL